LNSSGQQALGVGYGGRVVDFIAVAEPFEYGLLIEDHGRSSAISFAVARA